MNIENIKSLSSEEMKKLSETVRERIISAVSKNGGHLASSLGAVDLTIALLRVFNPPQDKIVWDVGHQAYAWKMLTDGRWESFDTIRRYNGMSPFVNPLESKYDSFVAGHAGVALAAAEGIAAARDKRGTAEHVVAVIGDASLTNGGNLEALNNCSSLTKKLILVVNDNRMSISQNVGAFARFLGRLLSGVRYNKIKAKVENAGHKMRLTFLRGAYHKIEQSIKSLFLGNTFFESFGMRYVGPVDGHDINALESAFEVARNDKRSVVIHVVTQKGKGFKPAEAKPSVWHGVGPFDKNDPKEPLEKVSWSSIFGAACIKAAKEDERVCALTAAMQDGTGLGAFAKEFPDRFFDVGICEGHLLSFAAGLASNGMKPIVAVYSTFLQRAVDQVMHDICIAKLPVVIGIDRAGVVGQDGKTHNGVFDIPMLRAIPNLSICQARSLEEFNAMFQMALDRNAPVAIRYPRGCPSDDVRNGGEVSKIEWGKAEVLESGDAPIQIWTLGDYVPKAYDIMHILKKEGLDAGIVNARFVKPLDVELLKAQARRGVKFVTIENGVVAAGFGSAVREALSSTTQEVLSFGWADDFIPHGSIEELEAQFKMTSGDIAEKVLEKFKKES
ncbi:MAG: 1-deoxy-D-xylulose-5-phosphate synthase [Kiritimatiellae bacterium]|nr:1-deoxy-D-xylulose-5-phosphate synthase [Kiritimatiellia bacterium]